MGRILDWLSGKDAATEAARDARDTLTMVQSNGQGTPPTPPDAPPFSDESPEERWARYLDPACPRGRIIIMLSADRTTIEPVVWDKMSIAEAATFTADASRILTTELAYIYLQSLMQRIPVMEAADGD